MEFLMILGADLSYACRSCATRLFQVKVLEQEKQIPLYFALSTYFSALFFFAKGGFRFDFSPLLLLIGIFIGLGVMTCNLCGAKAMTIGSMMLCSIFANMSLVIPVTYSAVLNGEGMTGLQVTGLVLVLTTIILASMSKNNPADKKKLSFLWLILVLINFAMNGVDATLQKVYLLKAGKESLYQFCAWYKFVAGSLLLVQYLRIRKAKPLTGTYNPVKRYGFFVLLALCAGLLGMIADGILALLCTTVPGAVLYPCINGGACVLTVLASFVFFQEKPTLFKVCAVCTGITAIVILNI